MGNSDYVPYALPPRVKGTFLDQKQQQQQEKLATFAGLKW
jgi:hypothetical protein